MSKTARTAAKPNIYQIVTDRIIHSLDAGVIPWEKPWKTPRFHGGPFRRNFRTGKLMTLSTRRSGSIGLPTRQHGVVMTLRPERSSALRTDLHACAVMFNLSGNYPFLQTFKDRLAFRYG
jgi:hypothetical protein